MNKTNERYKMSKKTEALRRGTQSLLKAPQQLKEIEILLSQRQGQIVPAFRGKGEVGKKNQDKN